VDTIDSSNGQEDHVSMGANAATRCYRVLKNTERILGIELFTAAQALDLRRPARSSAAVEKTHSIVREKIPFIQNDVFMQPHMVSAVELLYNLPVFSFEKNIVQ
jgi:histidine ammonia-lyase